MNNNNDHIFVIFGASGDLTKRKLLPAIYNLYLYDQLPEKFAVVGTARSKMTDDEFRNIIIKAIKQYENVNDENKLADFSKLLFYIPADTEQNSSLLNVKKKLEEVRKNKGIGSNTIFYLSTPPSLYYVIPELISDAGMNQETDGWKRLIIEKPFGYDLESAQKLNEGLMKNWNEEQIYRIDHYLGKETVQNILVTRFSNGIFEPLWNRNYIHRVEITSAEDIGVEKRGGYYDSSGALRDMVQNHLLQLAGLIAMEPPASLEAMEIRSEILKVFRALKPINENDVSKFAIRGQYLSSVVKGKSVPGYRDEENINPDSKTETYAALRFYIDNWRWGGVPFYIRTGKRLPTRVTEAVIHFKPTPHFLFTQESSIESCNQLILRIQPDEGILLKFGMKVPGSGFKVQNVNMDFHYTDLNNQRVAPAYERLIFDTMSGDKTLFAAANEVMATWKFLKPVIDAWEKDKSIPVYGYPAGTWGPENADELILEKGMTWRYPCKNLTNDGIYCEL
ncbi:MAG TPA: glucose-6-phosphate dehydrogenase [Ignavibacteriales bacterium]|nr:glucose-6-phosphate dehydrogenase [Ignavibacteriales bacterium]